MLSRKEMTKMKFEIEINNFEEVRRIVEEQYKEYMTFLGEKATNVFTDKEIVENIFYTDGGQFGDYIDLRKFIAIKGDVTSKFIIEIDKFDEVRKIIEEKNGEETLTDEEIVLTIFYMDGGQATGDVDLQNLVKVKKV